MISTTLSEITRDIISEFQTKNIVWVYDDIIDTIPSPTPPAPSPPTPPPASRPTALSGAKSKLRSISKKTLKPVSITPTLGSVLSSIKISQIINVTPTLRSINPTVDVTPTTKTFKYTKKDISIAPRLSSLTPSIEVHKIIDVLPILGSLVVPSVKVIQILNITPSVLGYLTPLVDISPKPMKTVAKIPLDIKLALQVIVPKVQVLEIIDINLNKFDFDVYKEKNLHLLTANEKKALNGIGRFFNKYPSLVKEITNKKTLYDILKTKLLNVTDSTDPNYYAKKYTEDLKSELQKDLSKGYSVMDTLVVPEIELDNVKPINIITKPIMIVLDIVPTLKTIEPKVEVLNILKVLPVLGKLVPPHVEVTKRYYYKSKDITGKIDKWDPRIRNYMTKVSVRRSIIGNKTILTEDVDKQIVGVSVTIDKSNIKISADSFKDWDINLGDKIITAVYISDELQYLIDNNLKSKKRCYYVYIGTEDGTIYSYSNFIDKYNKENREEYSIVNNHNKAQIVEISGLEF